MVDPITIALAAKTGADIFTSGLGGLWGKKRPKVPKELGQIANELLSLARSLPNPPAALSRLATALENGANLRELPPESLEMLSRVAYDSSAGIADSADNIGRHVNEASEDLISRGDIYSRLGHRGAIESYGDADNARQLYGTSYAPVEAAAAEDALLAGSDYEQDERARHAGDLTEESLAVAQAQGLDASRLRGAGHSVGTVNSADTAAGADAIAKARYNAGEEERRLGFEMRNRLLPHADNVSSRAIRYGDSANALASASQRLRGQGVNAVQSLNQGQADLYGSAQNLAQGSQRLALTPWDANNKYRDDVQQSQIYGLNAHNTAHNAELDTARTRRNSLTTAHDAYSRNHRLNTERWQGRTNDIRKSVRGVTDSIVAGVGNFASPGGAGGGGGGGVYPAP